MPTRTPPSSVDVQLTLQPTPVWPRHAPLTTASTQASPASGFCVQWVRQGDCVRRRPLREVWRLYRVVADSACLQLVCKHKAGSLSSPMDGLWLAGRLHRLSGLSGLIGLAGSLSSPMDGLWLAGRLHRLSGLSGLSGLLDWLADWLTEWLTEWLMEWLNWLTKLTGRLACWQTGWLAGQTGRQTNRPAWTAWLKAHTATLYNSQKRTQLSVPGNAPIHRRAINC